MLNKKIVSAVAGLATVASIALAGPAAFASNSLTAGGSSFAGGMLKACAAEWNHNGDAVTYTSSSSGTGRSSFNSGSFDFGAADAPYGSADRKPADTLYVPLVAGPIAVAYNVPGVANLNLTPAVLGKILKGTITKWNNSAIKALNTSVTLPATDITVVYRNTTSGTTENFTNYLAQNAAAGWVKNSSFATAGGYTGSGSVGKAASVDVVNYIKGNTGTIGYADLKDTLSSNLKFAAVKNGAGQFVKPSSKTAGLFIAAQGVHVANNGLVNIDYKANVKGAYNVSLITYGLAHSSKHAKGATVKAFFGYVVNSCAPAKQTTLGYVALSGAIKAKAQQLIALVK
ncbi:MAG: hypothetical protein RL196_1420 [Actinomycetota bacterium]